MQAHPDAPYGAGPRARRVITNDGLLCASLARLGLGLAYAPEPTVQDELRTGRLRQVLEPYAPTVPGFFLYYPSVARRSAPLRAFVEAAKELARITPEGRARA